MSFDPFPPSYEFFFTTLEPALTFAGAVFAILSPVTYHQKLIPTAIAPLALDVHPASLMGVRQLGSCFLLFALLATFLLRTIHSSLRTQPILLERIVKRYLVCLAAADLTHIGFTFLDLGLEGTKNPALWNTLVWGNCGITGVLFLGRMLWFAGVARGSSSGATPKRGA